MNNGELIPHLFRTEYRKIVSVLSRRFGFDQIEIAEDITSETFLTAAQTWGVEGPPVNPAAWLYQVAKNKAKNHLHRQSIFENKVAPEFANEDQGSFEAEIDLSPQNINDSQLQMMFAICQPAISTEAQIGLALRILCGFGIEEIADAFLTSKETIAKRLFRAREKLRAEKSRIELPGVREIEDRLETVMTTIYLLFNEGYYSASQNQTVRKELCFEAIRLCYMLVENDYTNRPQVNALLSLMCFHASRFDARIDREGEPVLYENQDTALWNTDLIGKGAYFLSRSACGDRFSKYHLEAGIAYWNTQKEDSEEKWQHILHLYNQLLQLEYSPIAALNRTYAVSKIKGKVVAIKEAEKLGLVDNPLYHILLGELHSETDNLKALSHLEKALELTKSNGDRKIILKKLMALNAR